MGKHQTELCTSEHDEQQPLVDPSFCPMVQQRRPSIELAEPAAEASTAATTANVEHGYHVVNEAQHHQQCSSSSSNVLTTDDLSEEYAVEVEELHGTVVLGQDGQFYVALNTAETNLADGEDIVLEQFGSVFVTQNGTDGAQTLVFDDTAAGGGGRHGKAVAPPQLTALAEQDRHGLHSMAQQTAPFVHRAQPSADNIGQQQQYHHEQQQQHLVVPLSPAVYDAAVAQRQVESLGDECGHDNNIVDYEYHGDSPGGQRRSRVFGRCRCAECGQTFVNMARLERHLSVHQQYGHYLCPLCGKTYKYEYNLFFHWRRTCRDMNELLSQEERKALEINALRQLVEEIAQKKRTIGPLVLDDETTAAKITVPLSPSPPMLRHSDAYQQPQQTLVDKTLSSKLTMANLFGDKLAVCELCGLTVYNQHLPVHRAVHRGARPVDGQSVGGAFFCNLCGLMFRTNANLVRHWRTGCATIHANLPDRCDIAMDDAGLKQMVVDLLQKLTYKETVVVSTLNDDHIFDDGSDHYVDDDITQQQPTTSSHPQPNQQQQHLFNHNTRSRSSTSHRRPPPDHRFETVFSTAASADMVTNDQRQQQRQQANTNSAPPLLLDEQWARAEGIFFADDFLDDAAHADGDYNAGGGSDSSALLQFNADGRLVNAMEEQHQQHCYCPPPLSTQTATIMGRRRAMPTALAADVPTTTAITSSAVPVQHQQQHGALPQAVRGMDNGCESQWVQYAQQSVQCSECFRSFSSVQRLEKHMAGTHCSFGTHHCLLCGSRFKYDYNLLFHYRQVCPYTLKLLSQERRQQLEAVDLKKTVRRIASNPAHLLPVLHTSVLVPMSVPPTVSGAASLPHALSSSATMQQQSSASSWSNLSWHDGDAANNGTGTSVEGTATAASSSATQQPQELPSPSTASSTTSSTRPELGDSVIRRQMMKKIIQKHVKSRVQCSSAATPSSHLSLPQQLLQSIDRPNLPDGAQCPICSIVFYGLKVLVRHLRAAHPNESSVWERTLCTLGQDGNKSTDTTQSSASTKLCPSRLSSRHHRKRIHEASEEQQPPPLLEVVVDHTTAPEVAQQQQSSQGKRITSG